MGYTSRTLNKAECVKKIIEGHANKNVYDQIQGNQRSKNDNTSQRVRLINVLFCDHLVRRLEYLGAKKTRAELDAGGAGKDQLFWKDVLLEFNEKNSHGSLHLTKESDIILLKEKSINASQPDTTKTWEDMRTMYQVILKDYKLKLTRYKTSGTQDADFHNFCHGRLDTYYMHVCLQMRGPNTLEGMVGNLPDEAKYDSAAGLRISSNTNSDNASLSSVSNAANTRHTSRKRSVVDVMDRYVDGKTSSSSGRNAASSQRAMATQLESYMSGMNQLLELEKKKDAEYANLPVGSQKLID
jgi:hypothetical protein